jgi:hypothetical protein
MATNCEEKKKGLNGEEENTERKETRQNKRQ